MLQRDPELLLQRNAGAPAGQGEASLDQRVPSPPPGSVTLNTAVALEPDMAARQLPQICARPEADFVPSSTNVRRQRGRSRSDPRHFSRAGRVIGRRRAAAAVPWHYRHRAGAGMRANHRRLEAASDKTTF